MTTNLQSTISTQLGWIWRDHIGVTTIVNSNRLLFYKNLADGPDADQSDAIWHAEEQTLAAGQSTTLALDMLPQSLFGGTVSIPLARIKAIQIVNRNTTDGYLLVGGASSDPWHEAFGSPGSTVKVMPDSPLLLASSKDGWSVGFGQNKLKITAVGTDTLYDIAVIGVLVQSVESSSSGIA